MKHLSSTNQNSQKLENVPTPTNGGDAVNKSYVDTLGQYPYATQRAHKATNVASVEFEYEVITIHTGGRFIPKLVNVLFANDWENSGTSGPDFQPVRETLESIYDRKSFNIIANSCAGSLTGVNEIRGLQIKDGVMYHDIDSGDHGSEGLGFFPNGTTRTFSYHSGDTGASVLASGVIDTFSYGPIVVKQGVKQNLSTGVWAPEYGTKLSARQCIGQTSTGDVKIISARGVTGVSGASGPDMANIAFDEGLYNAVLLDGGGSVQVMAGGRLSHASSATEPRAVTGFLGIDVPLIGDVTIGPRLVNYRTGFTPSGTAAPYQVVRINDIVYLDFSVRPTTGTLALNSWVTFADGLDREMRAVAWEGDNFNGAVIGTSAVPGILSISPTDSLLRLRDLGSTVSWAKGTFAWRGNRS